MRRRELVAGLRRLRAGTGLAAEEAAGHLECPPAKGSRMETGGLKCTLNLAYMHHDA